MTPAEDRGRASGWPLVRLKGGHKPAQGSPASPWDGKANTISLPERAQELAARRSLPPSFFRPACVKIVAGTLPFRPCPPGVECGRQESCFAFLNDGGSSACYRLKNGFLTFLSPASSQSRAKAWTTYIGSKPLAGRREIGSGSAAAERDEAALVWHFQFGLCLCENGRGRLIPESEAHDLWKLIASWCSSRRLALTGEYRGFTPEESGTDDRSDTAPTIPHS
jgi:hypothetical protein